MFNAYKNIIQAACWWLTSVIQPTQEAKIRKIAVRSQPGQIVPRNFILKNPSQK
jgi:hypothetical protein